MTVIRGNDVKRILEVLGINQSKIVSVTMRFPLNDMVTADIECLIDIKDEEMKTELKKYKLVKIEE